MMKCPTDVCDECDARLLVLQVSKLRDRIILIFDQNFLIFIDMIDLIHIPIPKFKLFFKEVKFSLTLGELMKRSCKNMDIVTSVITWLTSLIKHFSLVSNINTRLDRMHVDLKHTENVSTSCC